MYPREVSVEEARDLLAGPTPPVLLDVRNHDEFAWARLPGAVLIPLPELEDREEELDGRRPHLVLCHHGVRSLAGSEYLKARGFDAASIRGGIEAWSLKVDPQVPRY
jgi:rhodanese-related sulfurtransferase